MVSRNAIIKIIQLDYYFADTRFPRQHYFLQALCLLEHLKDCTDDCGAIEYMREVLTTLGE